jgi:hypothetical protein
MQRTFPDMNTPEAEIHLQDDEGVLADYTIGRQFVYASIRVVESRRCRWRSGDTSKFAWSRFF